MAVVIDLDAVWRLRQLKRLGQTFQQAGLCRAFRHAARQTFAGIAQGVFDQLGLFAALGHAQNNLAPGLFGQDLGHQVGVLDAMREQHHARRHLAVIELRQKGLHHLIGGFDAVELGIEIAVAPALVAADEEHLHTGLTALHMQRDHIRLGDAARVDRLHRLHGGQRLDPVAQGGGAFIFHRRGSIGHLARQIGLHGGGLALQEAFGILHQGVVIGLFDPPGAGGRATLDLEQQAGAGAAAECRIGA